MEKARTHHVFKVPEQPKSSFDDGRPQCCVCHGRLNVVIYKVTRRMVDDGKLVVWTFLSSRSAILTMAHLDNS